MSDNTLVGLLVGGHEAMGPLVDYLLEQHDPTTRWQAALDLMIQARLEMMRRQGFTRVDMVLFLQGARRDLDEAIRRLYDECKHEYICEKRDGPGYVLRWLCRKCGHVQQDWYEGGD